MPIESDIFSAKDFTKRKDSPALQQLLGYDAERLEEDPDACAYSIYCPLLYDNHDTSDWSTFMRGDAFFTVSGHHLSIFVPFPTSAVYFRPHAWSLMDLVPQGAIVMSVTRPMDHWPHVQLQE